jgi:hypothetical protein
VKQSSGILLTAKDLKTGGVGKTGSIGAICYQNATNLCNQWAMGRPWGSGPEFLPFEMSGGLFSEFIGPWRGRGFRRRRSVPGNGAEFGFDSPAVITPMVF